MKCETIMMLHIHDPALIEAPAESATKYVVICQDPNCIWTIPFSETILSREEFEERFHPTTFPDGDLFGFEHVKNTPARNVWTIVENDETNNWYALPGFHIVNKIGYVTSVVPWTDDIAEAMYFLDDFDHEGDEDEGDEDV